MPRLRRLPPRPPLRHVHVGADRQAQQAKVQVGEIPKKENDHFRGRSSSEASEFQTGENTAADQAAGDAEQRGRGDAGGGPRKVEGW